MVVRGPAQESYGLSRVEAFRAGTPVVATAVGEQRFVVTYEHGRPESLFGAITVALDQAPSITDQARSYFDTMAIDNFDRLLALYRGSSE